MECGVGTFRNERGGTRGEEKGEGECGGGEGEGDDEMDWKELVLGFTLRLINIVIPISSKSGNEEGKRRLIS